MGEGNLGRSRVPAPGQARIRPVPASSPAARVVGAQLWVLAVSQTQRPRGRDVSRPRLAYVSLAGCGWGRPPEFSVAAQRSEAEGEHPGFGFSRGECGAPRMLPGLVMPLVALLSLRLGSRAHGKDWDRPCLALSALFRLSSVGGQTRLPPSSPIP